MRLGIVGHAQEKFTPSTEIAARKLIQLAVAELKPEAIVSGHSPMGGVDWYAEDEARSCSIPMLVFEPKVKQWDPPGAYGFKARNLDIARHSDIVLVVVVKELPEGFRGKTFGLGCYHCRDRTPPHVKSGGCWTAWRCKDRMWEIIG